MLIFCSVFFSPPSFAFVQRIPLTLDKGTGLWSLDRELPVSFLYKLEILGLWLLVLFIFRPFLKRRKDNLNINIS